MREGFSSVVPFVLRSSNCTYLYVYYIYIPVYEGVPWVDVIISQGCISTGFNFVDELANAAMEVDRKRKKGGKGSEKVFNLCHYIPYLKF